jgi:hypothetical protein
MREVENVIPQLSPSHFPVQGGFSSDEFARRLNRYEALTESLRSILVVGCSWGAADQAELWTRLLDRISNISGPLAGLIVWINIRRYPALLLMYSGGIAAVAQRAYHNLAAVLTLPKLRAIRAEDPLVSRVNAASEVLDHQAMRSLPGLDRHRTPVSDYLFTSLREPLPELLPDDSIYQRCFDRFEYLLGLICMDINERSWAPVGCFIWRNQFADSNASIASELKREFESSGENWGPLQAGLFGGSTERYKEVQAAFDAFVMRVSQSMW